MPKPRRSQSSERDARYARGTGQPSGSRRYGRGLARTGARDHLQVGHLFVRGAILGILVYFVSALTALVLLATKWLLTRWFPKRFLAHVEPV